MRHKLLVSLITISIAANINCRCFAGGNESHNDNPLGVPTPVVDGAGGNTAPQINLAIQHDSGLSDEAKRVNVSYKDGAVILRGTVNTDGEKAKIGGIAQQCGAPNIRNEIVVAGKSVGKAKVSHKAKTIYVK